MHLILMPTSIHSEESRQERRVALSCTQRFNKEKENLAPSNSSLPTQKSSLGKVRSQEDEHVQRAFCVTWIRA